MKKNIHPAYEPIKVKCSCGNEFSVKSTLGQSLNLEVCAKCHPFYTGQQKIVDTAGRVDSFNKKYAFLSASTKASTESDESASA
jgi:large subunit ribosomal protein L31